MLVAQTTGSTTTRSTQDLVAPLSQMLQVPHGTQRTDYVYGHERLLALHGTAQTWYGSDALGSVRQTLDATGAPLSALHYDPWGTPQGGATPPTFGFTGELQEPGGLVYLRARWYQPQQGRFLSRDPFPGNYADPVTFHPYVYAAANPSNRVDPSGRCYGYLESLRNISFEAEWCRNLDKAVIIYHHPRATWSQKATAYAYAYTWYAGHAIIIGMAIAGGYAALEAGVGWVMTAGSAWLLTKCSSPPPSGPLPSLPPIAPPIEPVPSPDEVLASFTGRTINHFTDAAGIRGITGVSAETLRVGESVVAEQARFGFGSNIYMASAAGDIFVTDLPMDATSGQLNNIGVFAPKTDYVISMGEGELFYQDIRITWTWPERGIGTIPGGTLVEGPVVVTRLR